MKTDLLYQRGAVRNPPLPAYPAVAQRCTLHPPVRPCAPSQTMILRVSAVFGVLPPPLPSPPPSPAACYAAPPPPAKLTCVRLRRGGAADNPAPVELELPNKWLWDIIDEFIYQVRGVRVAFQYNISVVD